MSGLIFASGAVVSLAASWVLVTRLERIGARLGASEALLGLLAALAADAPEITSAVSALQHHQGDVGAGVVVGSNVFNLAALLGLAAVVAGVIRLHRPVVVLAGAVALGVAGVTVATATGAIPVGAGLGLTLAVLAPAVGLSVVDHSRLRRWGERSRLGHLVELAVAEEEQELSAHPRPGGAPDVAVGALALVVVVVASVAMERAATDLGRHVPGIVIGGIVLAAVTSLPNAVAAVYLARRGRGAAVLSTAMNSNALNVAAGFMIPAAVIGLSRTSASEVLVCGWYAGLTAVALLLAWKGTGLTRAAGALILAAYGAFVAVVVIGAGTDLARRPLLVYLAPAVVVVGAGALALRPRRSPQ